VFAVVFFTFARLAREHWVGSAPVYTANHHLMLIVQLLRERVVSMRFSVSGDFLTLTSIVLSFLEGLWVPAVGESCSSALIFQKEITTFTDKRYK
jgi:hypothetical protein